MVEVHEGITDVPGPEPDKFRPFSQRYEAAEGRFEWREEDRELPQVAILLPNNLPVPKRVQLEVMHLKE